tara:strand:- start:307 stop:1074 length:768 start_codon:yes stop_codon:yes gene_type:complete
MINIIIIGAGNVGTYFFYHFKKFNGLKIKGWYSRNLKSLDKFKSEVDIYDSIKKIKSADLYLIAVNDASIKEIVEQLSEKVGVVIHTSGSEKMEILKKFKNHGVLYPLQTFSKNHKIINTSFPYLIETNNIYSFNLLKNLLSKINSNYQYINSEKRALIHLAGVFVNNFTNHLFEIGFNLCKENNFPPEKLIPLIEETVCKIEKKSPHEVQTGPASRNDKEIISKHIEIIKNPILKNIYSSITNSILNSNEKEKL